MEQKNILKEDTTESILLAAGFIPVIGEIFDVISIIRYINRKEYLFAGLMIIALIPTVGDFIVKPFITTIRGISGGGRLILRNSDDLVKLAKSNPKLAENYLKVQKHLGNPKVGQLISQIEKIPGFGTKWARGMRESITQNKMAVREVQGLTKTIGKEISAGGKFSTGFKGFFQQKALANYVAKKGMEPKTWLSNWWNVVRVGRKDRLDLVRKVIVSNNILEMFGLPSIESFEDKLENDPSFREELAQNPQFSQVVNQSGITGDELSSIEGGSSSSSVMGDAKKSMMSLAMLKTLARLYT